MVPSLDSNDLAALIARVFRPREGDRAIAMLVDLPDARLPDNPRWKARREMAARWVELLQSARNRTGLDARLVLYRNVGTNNADLPAQAWPHDGGPLPATADEVKAEPIAFGEIFEACSILIAPTELSATAPLKLLAKHRHFRAATMPGFGAEMIPALKLDYTEINRRVGLLKGMLDSSFEARFLFRADGAREYRLTLDLRHRTAHASGGLLHEPGTAGNLPSGEAYVVPYEGELRNKPSHSEGVLPVQLGDEIVVYRIEANRAVSVIEPTGPVAKEEARKLEREPAYGNLAELGLGVLGELGVESSGEILLDEKLGLHIAFGRSDHFGGQVGAAQFSSPQAVVHIDRVYIPSLQPRVAAAEVDLVKGDGSCLALMRDGRYVVSFAE
jgi:hypothetical protein